MNIKKLLHEMKDIEICVYSANSIAANAKNLEVNNYIHNDNSSNYLQVEHSIIANIAEQQVDIAQSKVDKPIEAK